VKDTITRCGRSSVECDRRPSLDEQQTLTQVVAGGLANEIGKTVEATVDPLRDPGIRLGVGGLVKIVAVDGLAEIEAVVLNARAVAAEQVAGTENQ